MSNDLIWHPKPNPYCTQCRSRKVTDAESLKPYPICTTCKKRRSEARKAETCRIMVKTWLTDIRNLDAMPRGVGARYLEVIAGPDGSYIAKRWRRKPPRTGIVIDLTPKENRDDVAESLDNDNLAPVQ